MEVPKLRKKSVLNMGVGDGAAEVLSHCGMIT